MKKIIFCMMAMFLSMVFIPMQVNAANEPSSLIAAVPATNAEYARAKILEFRLNEIKSMDLAKMNSAEKKDLRKEVRSINHELRAINNGVYLSVGTILIVILILVLLL